MVAAPTPTQIRPETRVFRVEELIAHARAGRIRVPSFQRGFKWEREDVQKLIDSIWRGYPIGSLLLWSRPGPAGRVAVGDLAFDVSEQPSAWFVVDGQQRIVSLVSTLNPGRRAARFDLYFDLETGTVVPPRSTEVPATHVPLNRVIDSEELLAWIDDHRTSLAPEQVRLAFRVGKALREYELAASVVHIEDEAVVREIFQRTNSTAKALHASEVFGELDTPDQRPARSLKEVIERLRSRSLGELDEDWVMRGLLAIEQKAPARELAPPLSGVDLSVAAGRVERALDRALGFLAQDARIPHLRLLPYRSPLIILSAYFDRFSTPSARARRLLTRWLWRDAATPQRAGLSIPAVQQQIEDERVALEAVHAGPSDEEAARGILATVPARRPKPTAPGPFNLKYARSRLSVIALAELRPHDLRTGAPLDVRELLESSGELAPEIMTYAALPSAAGLSPTQDTGASSVGNRLLHPSVGEISMLTTLMRAIPPLGSTSSTHGLASHAISAEAVRALQKNDSLRFLQIRRDEIEAATDRLVERHAEWDHSDRPSIASLIDEED